MDRNGWKKVSMGHSLSLTHTQGVKESVLDLWFLTVLKVIKLKKD